MASGFNVYPREVEEVLYQHESIEEAAVIGVPDPSNREGSEAPRGYIVRKDPGSEEPSEEAVNKWMRERLAGYKMLSGGVVFSGRRSRLGYNSESDWKGGAFALGFTRLADFNTGSNYLGTLADSRSLFQRLREPRTPLTGTTNGSIVSQAPNSYYNLDGIAYGAFLTDVQKQTNGSYQLEGAGTLRAVIGG